MHLYKHTHLHTHIHIHIQVEINTIASSFGGLSTKIAEMNRLFHPDLSIPKNNAMYTLAQALAYTHYLYKKLYTHHEKVIIIMVVQSGERNFADQRHIDYTLLDIYNIQVVRLSLAEIEAQCVVDEKGTLVYEGVPVSVVYVSNCCVVIVYVEYTYIHLQMYIQCLVSTCMYV